MDGEGNIQTDLYRKPNKKCQRNVSIPGLLEVRLEELQLLLLSRGYKAGAVRQAIHYGKWLDRDRALEKVTREEKNKGRVRYTITYDSKLPPLPHILNKNWKVMIQTDQRLKKAFHAPQWCA